MYCHYCDYSVSKALSTVVSSLYLSLCLCKIASSFYLGTPILYIYYLVISADISILLWFCTCYKSLPSVLIFSSIGTLGSSYRTPGSSYRTLGSGMFVVFFKGGTKITYVGNSEYMYNFFGDKNETP